MIGNSLGANVPHHFEFDFEHKILLTVMEGEVQGAEIPSIDQEMRARIVRMQPAAGISDLTGVTNFNVPGQTMRSAALQPPPFPPETPRFIVAPTDFLYGMSRMYELVADRPHGKLQVVRSREEALSALGLSNPKFEPID
jgi:hypothetical protein